MYLYYLILPYSYIFTIVINNFIKIKQKVFKIKYLQKLLLFINIIHSSYSFL
jgi:hypothetical protein